MVDSYCCETENSDAPLFVHWKNRHEQYLASYNNTYILCLMQKVTFYSQYILLEYVQTVHLLVCERFSVLYFLGISHFIVKRNIILYNVIEPHQNLAVHGYHFHLIEKSSSGFNKKNFWVSFVVNWTWQTLPNCPKGVYSMSGKLETLEQLLSWATTQQHIQC